LMSNLAFATAGPVTTAVSVTSCNIRPISVPVLVTDFNDVGGISLTLNYNPSLFQYLDVILNPAIDGSVTNGSIPGVFILSYTCDPEIDLPDNSTLFTLEFSYTGPPEGGTSPLTWAETPIEANEYSNSQGVAYEKTPFEDYFINGSLTVDPEGCSPWTAVTDVTTCPYGEILVPITVLGFNNVGGVSLTLNYDGTNFIYQDVILNPAIAGSVTNGATPGLFILSYTCNPEIYLPDNTVLFTLKLKYTGPPEGGTFPLTWAESPVEACEYSDAEGVAYPKVPFNDFFVNGTITLDPEGCGPMTILPDVISCPYEPILVPVTVNDFNNVGGISLRMNYDNANFEYVDVELHPAIAGSITNGAIPGLFILSYTCDPEIYLPDNTVLFTLEFNYTGPFTGGTFPLT